MIDPFNETLMCPKCNKEYKKKDFFYTDHEYSLKHYQMCFHCCRMILGHAGYGE
jgi:hypothetical protein